MSSSLYNLFLLTILSLLPFFTSLQSEVYLTPPLDFKGYDLHVVAAFIKARDKVLFMKVSPHKRHPNQWAIPGGKVKKGESLHEAVHREIKEETSLDLDCKFIKTVYIQSEYAEFVYHMFEAKIPQVIDDIPLSSEHTALAWWTLEEALRENLMSDEPECILIAYPKTRVVKELFSAQHFYKR